MLTPVFRSHAPVDHYDYGNEGDVEEHYSNVFHRDEPGRIVAKFFGLNHSADAKAYCDWCQTRDESDMGVQQISSQPEVQLLDWLDRWEQDYADGQTRISRDEAIRRWEQFRTPRT